MDSTGIEMRVMFKHFTCPDQHSCGVVIEHCAKAFHLDQSIIQI